MTEPNKPPATDVAVTKSSFRHVLLTRFNVRWDESEDGPSIGTSPDWLERRFGLFERYCLPSLRLQSCLNFKWLIFFDHKTPEPFAKKARALPEVFDNIVPVFCRTLPETVVSEMISTLFLEAPQRLLTTRLDNDDGLHREFIQTLQSSQRFQNSEVLNFPDGLVLNEGRTYLQRHLSNAFISLSEPFSERKTVFSIARHVYASESYPVRQLRSGPMWLQVIHGGNISNRVRGRRMPAAVIGRGFAGLDNGRSLTPESPITIFAENMTLGIARTMIDLARMTVRRSAKFLGIDVRRRARV